MKTAYEWTLLLVSFGVMIQTLEYFSLKKYFSDSGIWRWSELREEFSYSRYFDFLLSEKSFSVLLAIRLMGAIALLLSFSFPVLFLLLMTSLLISFRFRGSFNGGSDYMTAIILLALTIAAFFKTHKIMVGVLWYIALQSLLSYFFAGLVKIKQSNWRTGKSLSDFIHSPNYAPPLIIKKLLKNERVALVCAWMVMGFELVFPLVIFLPKTYVLIVLLAGFLFHLNNVFLFGLNRFLWAWLATYPAIYFVAKSFSNSP